MERLTVCETVLGKYAVRPHNWAGIWDYDGKLADGMNSIAVFEEKEDAEWYAETKNAEEQGLLIHLPCKVGDKVYFTDRKYDIENRKFVRFVRNGYVKAIKFSSRPTKITIKYEDLDDRYGRYERLDIHASNIGKTVFLTKEEAEQALKGGVNDEHK